MASLRDQFPIFRQNKQNPLYYLDSAATTQKPQGVIDAIVRYYSEECSNIHRGVHRLSERATASYERSRAAMRRFIGAGSEKDIVFTGGATEGINLVAQTYGKMHVGPGDEIVISAMEHHSNIVPWQMLCEEKGAVLRVIPVDGTGDLSLEAYETLLGPKTRLVALTHISNVLGTVNPVRDMIRSAHRGNIPVLVDGAQSAGRVPLDVAEMDCDFFVLSGHKMYGPTGIGILYGKESLLDSMPPYRGGGDMIRSVSFDRTLYRKPPYKFEAGTPNIAGAIGLGAAVEFLESIGIENIMKHERELTAHATRALQAVDGLRLLGNPGIRAGVLSFVLEGIHPHDIAAILDREGVAIRAGHHCAQPLIEHLGVPATARISFGVYNTEEDTEALIRGLASVKKVFQQ
jgi:cysteine desulfurase/selenocysteine lyase